MKSFLQGLGGLLVALLGVCGGAALVQAADEPESAIKYRVVPYVWAAGIDGNIRQLGLPEMHMDFDFSDLRKDLDAGALLAGEAWSGRWGVLGELVHIVLKDNATAPSVGARGEARVRNTTGFLGAQYRALETEEGYFDVIAGARAWSQKTKATLHAPLFLQRSDSAHWVDPMVGVKGMYRCSPHFYVLGSAMMGGFDVGAQFTSDLMGGVGYSLSKNTGVILGYRHLSVDYKKGQYVFDAAVHGPLIGFDVRF